MNSVLVALSIVVSFGLGTVFMDVAVKKEIQHGWASLSQMKKECEETIPRSQHCIASIIFLPTASEE